MSKTAVIYHSIDADGWMSAAIVKHWFETDKTEIQPNVFLYRKDVESLTFIGYNYGQPIPNLSEYDKVIMCDISFPKDEMIKLWDKVGVDNMIWIDHHISAIKDIQDTKWLWEGRQDTKFAACELTWFYFFPNETMPEIVRLLGRYDCFGHKFTKEDSDRLDVLVDVRDNSATEQLHPYQEELNILLKKKDEEQKVLEFQYGARQCISNYEEAYEYLQRELYYNSHIPSEYDIDPIYEIHKQGKAIYQYLCTEAKQTYKNGFTIHFELNPCEVNNNVKKFICINKERFNPINFGIDYHKDGYDGCACFHYANGMWNFSLYNDNGLVDCSTIAKQFGGGGHFSASGFRCDSNTFLKIINNG